MKIFGAFFMAQKGTKKGVSIETPYFIKLPVRIRGGLG